LATKLSQVETANTTSKVDRSPRAQINAQASSDRQSDNESNTSGSGVAIKKTSKNTAQKQTKAFRKNDQQLKVESNPALAKHFDKVAPEKRLRNMQQLRFFLEKRY